ncbi:MAG: hypothetical protein V2A79_06480 [Planctomycetota bacterium]
MSDLDRELAEAMGWTESPDFSGLWVDTNCKPTERIDTFHPSTSLDQLHDIVEPEIERLGRQHHYTQAIARRLGLPDGHCFEHEWRVKRAPADVQARAALEVLKGGKR